MFEQDNVIKQTTINISNLSKDVYIVKIQNGFILNDNALQEGINKCVQYNEKNYSDSYKKKESSVSCIIFQKINEDKRVWNHYKKF